MDAHAQNYPLLCIHKELAAFVPLCRSLDRSDNFQMIGQGSYSFPSFPGVSLNESRVLKFSQPFQPFQQPHLVHQNPTSPHEPTTSDPDLGFCVMQGPSDLLRQNFFGGRALHVASISENPEVTRCRVGGKRFHGSDGGWMVVGCRHFQRSIFFGAPIVE